MSEKKVVEVKLQLNDFVSPTVAKFKVDLDVPLDDVLVGRALVQLAELVMLANMDI